MTKLVGKSTTYKIEGFTATYKYNDLALLKVSAPGINPLPIGNSDAVKIGETVYIVGNPNGLEGTFSDGIISRLKFDYADAYNNRGTAKHHLGQHTAAIQDFDKAIQLKSDYADAYNDRGNVKHHLGQYAAAIQDFDKAIQLEPNDANAYYNRGLTAGKIGQHFAAVQDFDIDDTTRPR